MKILGIDPGRKGGLALLDTETLSLQTWGMPADIVGLHDLIFGLPKVRLCVLEQVHAGVQMKRTSIGVMFENFGVLKSALCWAGIPIETVRPVVWKGNLNVPADKNASRRKASEIFPDAADQWKLAKDDGKAEAALLAWWGRGRG